ncbi:hypothetical protein HYW20_01180 [Candidatus Woesearchaeota archaeon]|nr:hypothetical protein [Candidatus Woesearchaeota archaeon]
MYYSVKLGKRLEKIAPSIVYSSFPFLTVRAINRTSKNFSKAAYDMLNVVKHFGSKEVIEKWFTNFMEVDKIKKLKDKEVHKYFHKTISLMSLFIRAWTIMMIGMTLILFLLFRFLP